MLQNVHYFDQISNVRYANKVCFFRTYKTPQTLEITRIAGLLFKSTLFLLTDHSLTTLNIIYIHVITVYTIVAYNK